MNNLIVASDFKGDLRINRNRTDAVATIEDYITKWQDILLLQLLGERLYGEFESKPLSSEWQKLINGEKVLTGNFVWNFKGLKPMLLHFIWYEYNRDSGVNPEKEDNPARDRQLIDAYNRGIEYYYDCVRYLIYNKFPNLLYYQKDKLSKIIKYK